MWASVRTYQDKNSLGQPTAVKPAMTVPHIPGLLLNGEWIPPLRSYDATGHSLAEIIQQSGDHMFPSHYLASFDLLLARDLEDPVSVDLTLVSKDLGRWYLLFVVPSRNANMESLVARLQSAREHEFSVREAQELARQIDELDIHETLAVIRNSPNLVVVTDDPRHNWSERLAASRVETSVMIVEPFLSGGHYVFRVNGDAPNEMGLNVIATCEYHPTIPNCLEVTWNNPNSIPQPGIITLRYGDIDTEWNLLQGVPRWQLQPARQFPLPNSPPFEIVEGTDGLFFVRSS